MRFMRFIPLFVSSCFCRSLNFMSSLASTNENNSIQDGSSDRQQQP